jgi:hypothetical protein
MIKERIAQYFDFTQNQLRCLLLLSATSLLMGGYLFVHAYTVPTPQTPSLPVFFGDEEKYVGLFILDPNTAPVDSLELLPGIGRVLADRIVEYRSSHQFEHEVDITEVKGIGPKLFERLRPYLKIKP